ncbi:gamma-glutamyl-gamma-aminobutyrate hydrolase family protein [Caballeronia sp. LZ035]|uniref:gamma-glutamyl-gamma-aminobutyrate hydrolase family protein n=1 Tax=Caballeronia sp. LZ035 TaxID=3038568 RepID=UPI002861F72F|nr:gamma-glutamyl-gamma-aminobutyrate hydrolase family protein [Caballeronia sp. LZ035]MDR5757817.1 gamma-glutamyl-gamma-aminobutyrate hydrolase family protein [Caballeronia sp. LZ035]
MSDNNTSKGSNTPDGRTSGAGSSTAGSAQHDAPRGANPTAPPEAAAAAAAPGPAASATERASTDAPSSAANVEPVDTQQARRDDAQQAASDARESAARATAAQAAAIPVKPAPADSRSSLAQNLEAATEAEAEAEITRTTNAQSAASDSPTGRTAPPATAGFPSGIAEAPDFGKLNVPHVAEAAPVPPQPAYLKQSDSAWSVFGRIIAARARQIFDRAGQRVTQRTLRIGVSARIFHPEPGAKGLRGKTLQYLEESIAHWVMSRDVLVFMIPTVGNQGMLHTSNIRLRDYAKHLDGLLLQGGADVSPQSYEEVTTRPEWPGDRVRDMYELELLHEFVESGKPVLGVCRGCQLINVAFGGTLYGDIATDVPMAGVHVSEQYDQHRHAIRFPDGSTLANMFPNQRDALVNSIHHQAVRTLGRDLNIEAVSASDGIIEAVRYRRAPFVVGVQWHPEFHRAGGAELLDCTPLLDTFLRVARETRF